MRWRYSSLLLACVAAACGDAAPSEETEPGFVDQGHSASDSSVHSGPGQIDAGTRGTSAGVADAGNSTSGLDATAPMLDAGLRDASTTTGQDGAARDGASGDASSKPDADAPRPDAGGDQPSGDCDHPPAQGELIGWASVMGGTRGGGDAKPMTITSFSALKSAASDDAPATLWIKGSLQGDLKIGSNKTLIGLCGAELHGHVEISGASNVIVRNLKIVGYAVGNCALDPSYSASEGCSSGQDAFSIQKNAHHIWIDHCDISDGTDGNLDITNGANYVTVSWTKFHYTPRTDNTGSDSTGAAGHRFSNLIGGTDNPSSYDDANALNVTWHHNHWADNVVERQPRVRFGKNHLFNNLWSSAQSSYCVRAGKQAQILIEKSVFDGVANPQVFNSPADQATASITARDNVYDNTSGTKADDGKGTPFTQPPYTYTPESTAGLAAKIRAQVGPR